MTAYARTSVVALGIAMAIAIVSAAGRGESPGQSNQPALRDVGPRPTGTAVLVGRVREAGSGAPVRRALVALDTGDGRAPRTVISDDGGGFAFDRLPASRLLVSASKAGWVTTFYGATRPGRTGTRIPLANGQRLEIDLLLVRGGVIAGRVVDERGHPMAGQWPRLLQFRQIGDLRLLVPVGAALGSGAFHRSTDDRGEYRLFGLLPGDYVISVQPSIDTASVATADELQWAMQPPGTRLAPAAGRPVSFAPSYHPGTVEAALAVPVTLRPGDEQLGVDVAVSLLPMSRVDGVVTRADGQPAQGAQVAMVARRQATVEATSMRTTAGADGRFAIPAVPPGDYRLTAWLIARVPARGSGAAAATPASEQWGGVDLAVRGQDIDAVSVALTQASMVTGRVVFEASSKQPPDPASVRLSFMPVPTLLAAMYGIKSAVQARMGNVKADGTFSLAGFEPDRYVVAAVFPGMSLATGVQWLLKSVRVGGTDVGDLLEVQAGRDLSGVVLTFTDRVASIAGLLLDAEGRPAPEYSVFAFPADRSAWTPWARSGGLDPVRPGTDGRFRVGALLPGEYYLAVVTSIESDDATNPSFLETLVPLAIRLMVAEGEQKTQDLKIVRR